MESHYKISFKIEPKPGGGFIAHSDSHPEAIEGATHEEIERKVREKLAQVIGPELAAQIPLNATDTPDRVGHKLFTVLLQKTAKASTTSGSSVPSASANASGPIQQSAGSQESFSSSSPSSGPIERAPQSAGAGTGAFVKFVLLVLVALFLAWVWSHR